MSSFTQSEQASETRQRVRQLVESVADKRVRIWARVRLGGERGVELAREHGYRSGAGVTLVVRRLEATARRDRKLKTHLEKLRHDAICK